jgi:hypothetical protein
VLSTADGDWAVLQPVHMALPGARGKAVMIIIGLSVIGWRVSVIIATNCWRLMQRCISEGRGCVAEMLGHGWIAYECRTFAEDSGDKIWTYTS